MKQRYAVELILAHFPDLTPEYVVRQLRYCTFVSVGKRYMYLEVPKAASTQMRELLRTAENAPPIKLFTDGDRETRREMFIHGRSNVPLPSLVDLDNRTQREVLESPDFLRMTVVRNPYTRLLSAWRNKVVLCEPPGMGVYHEIKGRLPDFREKSLVSFHEFVEYLETKCDLRTCDAHWRRQVDHTFFPALNFSCVARVEHLKEGLRRLKRHLGLSECLVADGRNVSIPLGCAAYTAELADRVYSLYRADFELLGYERNSWPAGRHDPNQGSRDAGASNQRFMDEIIERNLIISGLYEERDRLQGQLRRVSRLRLLSVINSLAALRSTSKKAAREVMGWAHRMLGSRCMAGGAQQ